MNEPRGPNNPSVANRQVYMVAWDIIGRSGGFRAGDNKHKGQTLSERVIYNLLGVFGFMVPANTLINGGYTRWTETSGFMSLQAGRVLFVAVLVSRIPPMNCINLFFCAIAFYPGLPCLNVWSACGTVSNYNSRTE